MITQQHRHGDRQVSCATGYAPFTDVQPVRCWANWSRFGLHQNGVDPLGIKHGWLENALFISIYIYLYFLFMDDFPIETFHL